MTSGEMETTAKEIIEVNYLRKCHMSPYKFQRQVIVFVILCLVSIALFADSARYSITAWSPYWIVESNKVSGILNGIMYQIDKRVDFTLEASDPVPVKRAKRQFKDREVQIECCVNKACLPLSRARFLYGLIQCFLLKKC